MNGISLDIRTLSFITTSITLFFFLALGIYRPMVREFRGFHQFASAVGLYAVGFLLLGCRDILPDFVTIILANLMIIAAIIFYFEGIRRFLDPRVKPHVMSIIGFIAGAGFFLHFTYLDPSVNARIITIASIHMLISALCVWELSRNLHVSWRFAAYATALVFAAYAAFQVFRIIWTLGEAPIQSFMSAGTVHAFAFISVIFLTTGSIFGFILMVTKRLEYRLTELAMHDPLTSVLNRRGIEFLASREIAKMGRIETALAIILIDIDHFKQVNDLYGHNVGDKVLLEFTQLIQNNLRTYDIFGRIGGEEFLILLPDTKLEKARSIAERTRRDIEEHVFIKNKTEVKITASFGVSNYFYGAMTLDNLIPFADEALIQSKQQGRNKVSSILQRDEA